MMAWNRILWGVEFVYSRSGARFLCGTAWMKPPPQSAYDGEPTRALLFVTRKQAREWCKNKQAGYANRSDSLAKWRFRPVRVREKVGKV